ncbi:MAG: DUF6690 family protein [Planctomycetota bacterium]
MPKPWVGALLLISAFGIPYFLFETPLGRNVSSLFLSATGSSGGEASELAQAGVPSAESWGTNSSPDLGYLMRKSAGNAGVNSATGSPAIAGVQGLTPGSPGATLGTGYQPIQALREVVRFDVNPNWVPSRFPRVTRVTSNMQLDGMRVPLVTGTRPSDLAGTLTYYFDRYQRVQRITVHAVTGDPSRFLAELQHAYQLQQQPSLGGGLYLKKWNGRPTSIVYTAQAPVLTEDNLYSRYQFFAELNQAGLEFGMSSEAQQLLASSQSRNQWQ